MKKDFLKIKSVEIISINYFTNINGDKIIYTRFSLLINGKIWRYNVGSGLSELYQADDIGFLDNYYNLFCNILMDESNPIYTINKFLDKYNKLSVLK